MRIHYFAGKLDQYTKVNEIAESAEIITKRVELENKYSLYQKHL